MPCAPFHREKSAAVKLLPQAMVVQGFGEHELSGAATTCGTACQPPFSYCKRVLGHRMGEYKELMDLAQRRETWRRLAKSL
jgi:hypothetical protein